NSDLAHALALACDLIPRRLAKRVATDTDPGKPLPARRYGLRDQRGRRARRLGGRRGAGEGRADTGDEPGADEVAPRKTHTPVPAHESLSLTPVAATQRRQSATRPRRAYWRT